MISALYSNYEKFKTKTFDVDRGGVAQVYIRRLARKKVKCMQRTAKGLVAALASWKLRGFMNEITPFIECIVDNLKIKKD